MKACNCTMGKEGHCCQDLPHSTVVVLPTDIIAWQIIEAPTVGKKYRVPVYQGGWMPASYEGYEVDWNYTEEKGKSHAQQKS